jgi:general secretion pathway protein G
MKNYKSEMRNKKGFSLVELLVVITIIAILSVVAYTAVAGNTVKARDAKRKQDLSTIQQALEIYYVNNAKYPTVLQNGDVSSGKIPKQYLSDIPVDPGAMKRSYKYAVGAVNTTYQIGTTLENEGSFVNYESYVVGNSDTPLLTTADGLGKWNNGGAIASCTGAKTIGSGAIQTADANYTAGPPAKSCVPYDPLN